MDLDRAIKVQKSATSAMYSIYSGALISKSTSKELNCRYLSILSSMPKGTPRHVREFIRGMHEVLNTKLQQEHIEFCYQIDGKLYSVRRDSVRYYEKHGITPKELNDRQELNGMFWMDTDKEFFIG